MSRFRSPDSICSIGVIRSSEQLRTEAKCPASSTSNSYGKSNHVDKAGTAPVLVHSAGRSWRLGRRSCAGSKGGGGRIAGVSSQGSAPLQIRLVRRLARHRVFPAEQPPKSVRPRG